ncbi:MAG: hypothetical protein QOC94_1523 [Actinoplanes sp.]|nr:hypothetical protein [Actinoplanes sp.]
MRIRAAGVDVLDEALGRTRRSDPVLPGAGGPAGNARLTAWTGVLLFVLFVAELVTLIDVRQLIGWHLVIGTLLVPPALLKTGTTGWRIVGYYTGRRPYRDAGPPPLLLRILGPLVVAGTLAVLGSGLLLILLGPNTSRRTLLDVLGQRIDTVTIHQATFAVWAVVTGLHTLARLVPAIRLTVAPTRAGRPVPGRGRRVGVVVVTVGIAAVSAALVLSTAGAWRTQPDRRSGPPPGRHSTR